ncbi:NAD(P)-binding protein [Venturia nashicola]|nr:NAD(P)-binding protein [Venturia nashicola]
MSFFSWKQEGKISPALVKKLDQIPSSDTTTCPSTSSNEESFQVIEKPSTISSPNAGEIVPRVLVIGAGSRGHAYSKPIQRLGLGKIVGVCEPVEFKRKDFGQTYIWGPEAREARAHEEFEDWNDFVKYETTRLQRVAAGELIAQRDNGLDGEWKGVDAVLICVLDEMHTAVIKALAPLGLHIMCEKPLATTLEDTVSIYEAVTREWAVLGRKTVFGIGHVLRYSPFNRELRRLVREEGLIGDVVSIEHTEPIGWWHMSHSYVRGNWRREDTTAPSLLTKSCHDIDVLLWLLCSPENAEDTLPPHLPSTISSSGLLSQFRNARKPIAAGNATNCLACPIEKSCIYSARSIYLDKHLASGNTGWPVKIVVPEIEDIFKSKGKEAAETRLLEALAEDYTTETPDEEIKARSWYGRCVYDADNDVLDDQTVTITWEDDPLPNSAYKSEELGGLNGRGAKQALFHMTSPTAKICERRGRIYGTKGEISYDSTTIQVHTFVTGHTETIRPEAPSAEQGHGGGDDGLAIQFLGAVKHVLEGGHVEKAQREWLGFDLEEGVRSHVAVFAAEKARLEKVVLDWKSFWDEEVEGRRRRGDKDEKSEMKGGVVERLSKDW